MRLLVCGGRNYDDYDFLKTVLSSYHVVRKIDVIIHGAAKGADALAAQWAERHLVPIKAYPAEWKKNGIAAGPIRNKKMLAEGRPDMVLAFPGGRGTADMIRQAKAAGIEVVETWV